MAFAVNGLVRSTTLPSSLAANALFASDREIDAAISASVVPAATSLTVPSFSVIFKFSIASTSSKIKDSHPQGTRVQLAVPPYLMQ